MTRMSSPHSTCSFTFQTHLSHASSLSNNSLATARSRARASVEYCSPLPPIQSSEDLQDVSQRIVSLSRRPSIHSLTQFLFLDRGRSRRSTTFRISPTKPLRSRSLACGPFKRYSIYASTRIHLLITPFKDTVFVHETAPQLRTALEEEAAAAQGHVDALRRSIISRTRLPQTSRRDNLGSGRVRGLAHCPSFLETLTNHMDAAAVWTDTVRYRTSVRQQ